MKISLSGLAGSGTTSVVSLLSEKLNIQVISAGIAFRGMASERNLSLEEFGKVADGDQAIDRLIDLKQKEMSAGKDDIIAEGRLSGHMINSDLNVWLKAPLEIRSKRVAKREGWPMKQALLKIKKRENCDFLRYKKYYQIDLNDLSIYDLIIDSSKWNPESIVEIILSALQELKN